MYNYTLKIKNNKIKYRSQDITKFVNNLLVLTFKDRKNIHILGPVRTMMFNNAYYTKFHIILIKLNLDIDLTSMNGVKYNETSLTFSKLNVKKLDEYGTYLFSDRPLDSNLNKYFSSKNLDIKL
jgi:hypothetical protein